MTLDVLICTFGPGGLKLVEAMELPQVEGVRYIVSWQEHGNVPEHFNRPDLEVHRLDLKGLSNNRNNAFAHSQADICLIADDDLKYTAGQLQAVIKTFEDNPDLDIAAFRYEGADAKAYPFAETPLFPYPKGYFASSIELAMRRGLGLRFDPRFGLGGELFTLGEEDVMLLEARRRGLNCRFFPIVITRHEGLTTGLRRMTDPKALAGTGAVISLLYPRTFLLRIPLKAWRMWRGGQASFFKALGHGLRGAWIAKTKIKLP